MPELRIDPVTGRRTYIAEDRAGRPSDFAHPAPGKAASALARTEAASEARRAACPFCAGHEAAAPIEAAAVRDAAGRWQVRVVPNKFPAVASLASSAPDDPAAGVQEVIIESPRHLRDLAELSPAEFAVALVVCRDRIRHWAADGRLRHAMAFKNSGYAAGASLEHIHSQLIVLPYVPDTVGAELSGAARYFAATGRCQYCDLLAAEVAGAVRLVAANAGFVAWCAHAGRQPYETWIVPRRHATHFEDVSTDEAGLLAQTLHEVVRRLHTATGGADYNLVLHSGPWHDAHAASYHWHWELTPRLAPLAGLELGAGVFINSLAPERAARRLREAL